MTASGRARGSSLLVIMEVLEGRKLLSSVAGVVYNDLDRDGTRDPGEPGLAGRTVFIDQSFGWDGVRQNYFPAAVSGADGGYRIDDLPGGDYHQRLRLEAASGWRRTQPGVGYYEFVLPAGTDQAGFDFGEARVPSLAGLTLVDADTDLPVQGVSLADGVTIDLADVGRRLNVRADVAPGVRDDLAPDAPISVRFNYDGDPNYRIENAAPYAIGGDAAGDFRAWTPSPGTHTLVVTPYLGRSGAGERGPSRTIVFNVIDTTPLPPPVRVNAGGPRYTDSDGDVFAADSGFHGGARREVTVPIAGTTDDALYQDFRSGRRFFFSRAVPDGDYTLALHFADATSRRRGQRRFDVVAEGRVVLNNYDVVGDVGPRRAVVKRKDVSVRDGRLDLAFLGEVGDAIVSAIELVPRAPRVATTGPVYVNAGGAALSDFVGRPFDADNGFVGGTATPAAFDVENVVDRDLFASYRSGQSFSFRRAVARGNYTLVLDFAEPDASAVAGSRTFDVFAEGRQVLDDYDVSKAAGGVHKARAEAFNVRVTDGSLDVEFRGVAGDAVVSAIVLLPNDLPEAARPYAVECLPEAERQARAALNLRMIGQGIAMYANENKGRLPNDLATVVIEGVPAAALADPRALTDVPRGELLPEVEEEAWARTLNDYLYLGAGLDVRRPVPPGTPLAYENPARVAGPLLVLFFDGHVELLERAEAARLIGFEPATVADGRPPADPASSECRPDPNVVKSQANLRSLGRVLQGYANEHRGNLPRDLGTLYGAIDGDPSLVVNPRGATPPPPDGMTRDQKVAFADAATDYVYIGRGLNYAAPGEVAIAYENPAEMKDGINLLFADGHVEFREMRWAAETIRRSLAYPRRGV